MGSPTSDDPRLVVVCGYPPTSTFGGGIILRSLLEDYPRDRLTIVTNAWLLAELQTRGEVGGLLDVPHIAVRPWRTHLRGLRRLVRSMNVTRVIPASVRIARACGATDVVMAIPWGGELGSELFVAAYCARLLRGAKLLVYEVDEWGASLGRASGRVPRFLERAFHARILRAAGAVWAMNEFLADVLRSKASITPTVAPYCLDLEAVGAPRRGERANEDELRIVYSGAVYGAQADAIRNLAHVLPTAGLGQAVLEIYTDASPRDLAMLGIEGQGVRVRPLVSPGTLMAVLRAADVLFLPFSFDSGQEPVVRTAFPTKTAEYLASGVPILVHAPHYSTVARMAQREGWGLVVEDPSPELLGHALSRLAYDEGLRSRLATTASRVARERHNLGARRAEFRATLRRLVHG